MWVASATIERCRGRGKDTLRKRGGYDARAAGWSSGGTPENPALAVAPRWGTIPISPRQTQHIGNVRTFGVVGPPHHRFAGLVFGIGISAVDKQRAHATATQSQLAASNNGVKPRKEIALIDFAACWDIKYSDIFLAVPRRRGERLFLIRPGSASISAFTCARSPFFDCQRVGCRRRSCSRPASAAPWLPAAGRTNGDGRQ